MDSTLKRMLITTAFGVTLFAVLSNIQPIIRVILRVGDIFQPLIIGSVIAFILNVPHTKISEYLTKLYKKKNVSENSIQIQSFILTILAIVAVIALVCIIVIPQLVSSTASAAQMVREKMPQWIEYLRGLGIDSDWLYSAASVLEKVDIMGIFKNSLSSITNVISTVTSTAGLVGNIAIAIVISCYMILSKKTLSRQFVKMMSAYLPDKVSGRVKEVGVMIKETYSDFFCGQCLEAVILGCLIYIGFAIFQLPYAGLVAVLTAVMSFVPIIGSFLACGVGAVLILLISPVKALISIVVFFIIQFCENQFIYPKIVGGSVGLPSMWTLLAVILGGKIFGVLGMIFFIPLVSVIYKLLSRNIAKMLTKKQKAKTQ